MELNPEQKRFLKRVTKRRLFSLFLFANVPAAWIAGMRLHELSAEKCVTSVPFKRLNKNPFKSMYFAVQSMAAESSTATPSLLAATGYSPSIACIIVDLKATFSKKATDDVFFTCEEGMKAFDAVEKCLKTGEAEAVTFKTVGKMKDGTVVSEFEITWSFKQRSS